MFILFISLLFLHPGNILFNSSFETWVLNQPVPWLTSQILNPGSALPDSDSYSGELAIKLDASLADTAFATQIAGVYAESTYHFKGWAKTSSAIGGAFIITWFKSLTEPVGIPIVVPITYSINYKEYAKDCVAHDSAQFVDVGIFALFGAIVLADSVTLDGAGWGVEENSKSKEQRAKVEICPNPFIQKTVIKFRSSGVLEFNSELSNSLTPGLQIYNLAGRVIRILPIPNGMGITEVMWDGKDESGIKVGSGVYFCLLKLENWVLIDKIIKL